MTSYEYRKKQVNKWIKKHKELNDNQWKNKKSKEKEYKEKNKKYLSERQKIYYFNNKNIIKDKIKERYKNDKEFRIRNAERNRKYTKQTRLRLRFKILEKYNFTCQYCGRKSPDVILEVDHKFPKSKGGENRIENYIVACRDCNSGKGDSILDEFKK